MASVLRAALISVFISIALVGTSYSSRASVVDDIQGMLTDPLKIGKLSDSVPELIASAERIMNQLNAFEDKTNAHVQARLEQVRDILNEAIDKVNADLNNAMNRMQSLERDVYIDANRLIYKAQCLGPNFDANVQDAFAKLIDNLIKANPKITLLGLSGDLKLTHITNATPDVAYRSLRNATFDLLKDTKDGGILSETSDPSQIFWAYQNLIVAARGFQCRYLDQAGEIAFIREANALELRSLPWISVVHMDLLPTKN